MDFISNDIKNEGVVKIRIDAVGGDLDRVACKYPVSFMNEMARQLTTAIESATGVEGLADSSVELIMMFASTTYMEHISGNVTYRRLMLIDAVSAPRDFWVKWTRLDSTDGEYNESNIIFELGEDVEQKVREKEYRYLLTAGKDKYHNSMGRKKVTEWREVIKRAAKRGELTKVESDFELAPETLELEERIADLLGKRIEARNQPAKEEVPYIAPESDDFARAMEKARRVVEETAADEEIQNDIEYVVVEEAPVTEEPSPSFEATSLPEEEDIVEEVPATEELVATEMPVIEEIPAIAEPSPSLEETPLAEVEAVVEEAPAIEVEFDFFADNEGDAGAVEELELELEAELDIFEEEIPAIEELSPSLEETPLSEVEEIATEVPFAEEPVATEAPVATEIPAVEEPSPSLDATPLSEVEEIVEEVPFTEEPVATEAAVEQTTVYEPAAQQITIADRVADIRAELETKIRLEYETRARAKAEQELAALRLEREQFRIETEAMLAEARAEQERLRLEYEHLLEMTEREAAARAAEDARRRAEEAQLREQIEAQLRQEASERERLAEAARMAIEEQHRLEAENARIARQREEEERAEAERLRRIEEEKAIEAARQAELERIRRENEEAKARAKNAMPKMGDGKPSTTNKTVKFLFRRSVDPNITTRIQEIIKATVDYYGKDNVYLKIRATIPDSQTVILQFADIPIQEMELLGNMIKILGNSGLGIAKAIID